MATTKKGTSKTSRHYRKNAASRRKRQEYQKRYNQRPEEKRKRRELEKERRRRGLTGTKKGRNKDLHHSKNGLKVEGSSKNRGRKEKSRRKGYKRK